MMTNHNAVMTVQDEICSILQRLEIEKNLTSWEKRELAQLGMNYSRRLPEMGDYFYLFFLKQNLSQRKTPPSWLGWLYFFIKDISLGKIYNKHQFSPYMNLNSKFSDFINHHSNKV